MKIEKLEIRNFGKMQNRTLEFSDGIQLISGENESGKSTVHTFIRSMLFGMTRGRGRAAKNDVYSRYEPWENPAYYAGEMVLESGGKRFRLTRNFGRQNANAKLVCLTDGEVLSVEDGDLSMLLGGVSEIVYDNTASIGQLKGRTEEGLADELRNYMANYQGSSDGELDVAAALDLLKQKRKRLEQEQKKTLAGLEKRKEELETKISVFTEECRQSEENLQQAKEQMKRDIYQKDVPIERVRKMKKESRKSRKWGAACVALAGFLLFLCILQFFHIDSLLTRTGLGLAIAALLYLAYSLFRHRKTEVEQVVTEPEEQAIRRQQWNVDRLKQELGQKQTVLSNLQSEYEELCISMTEKDHLQEELDALSLAGEAIQSLSVQMQSRIGDRLKQQMSKTLSSLTNGRYLQVNMDENLRIGLHTADEYVPLEQVSRGTIEQAYFALRMAAMDVLCGEEELPVILDESFAFYDENRLKETLKWLAENRTHTEESGYPKGEYCLGFVETKSTNKETRNQLRIEKIYDCEGMNEETSVDDVLVVYCALYPDAIEKETYVVGWYKHATVYRNCKVMRFLSDTEEEYYDQAYNAIAKKEDCVLLPRGARRKANTWKVPRKSKGVAYGFGQSNVWYAQGREQHNLLDQFLNRIVSQIENYDGENWIDKYAEGME